MGVQTDKQNLNILTFTVHISKGMLLWIELVHRFIIVNNI